MNLVSCFRAYLLQNLLVVFAVNPCRLRKCRFFLISPLLIDFKWLLKDLEQVVIGMVGILAKSSTKCLGEAHNLLSSLCRHCRLNFVIVLSILANSGNEGIVFFLGPLLVDYERR